MTDYIEKTCIRCGSPCRLDFDLLRQLLAPGTDAMELRRNMVNASAVYCKVCILESNWERF